MAAYYYRPADNTPTYKVVKLGATKEEIFSDIRSITNPDLELEQFTTLWYFEDGSVSHGVLGDHWNNPLGGLEIHPNGWIWTKSYPHGGQFEVGTEVIFDFWNPDVPLAIVENDGTIVYIEHYVPPEV